MNSLNVVTLILIASLLFSCQDTNKYGIAINDFGVYEMDNGLVLFVEDNEGIVVYQLKNRESKSLIFANSRASVFHNWTIVYKSEMLWFASGDIGSVVWIKNTNGLYEKKHVHNLPLDEFEIPAPIKPYIF